eukprot:TRINITY_DN3404_c0_g2_i17.p1 TRINITY_DN3404_c0_g2~~TRINITY_DN3404_c0_g2_i17.p1  ORF type:complete len:254 (+),score=60.22 TRINITY_DN3404_c0_g2_i17:123-884(+)
MEKQTTVWLIRHGYSTFNDAYQRMKTDPTFPYDKYSKDYVDAKLNDKGIEQCTEARKDVNGKNIMHVLVSPLQRALMTSELMFAEHPHLGKIQFVVHPLLREILKNANDVPEHTLKEIRVRYESLDKYKFDFSLFDKLEIPDLYYLLNLNSPIRDRLVHRIKESKEDDIDIVLEVIRAAAENKIETHLNVKDRLKKFKEYLVEFIKTNVKPGEEVAVVTHSEIITYIIATEFHESGVPKDMKINNCELFPWLL